MIKKLEDEQKNIANLTNTDEEETSNGDSSCCDGSIKDESEHGSKGDKKSVKSSASNQNPFALDASTPNVKTELDKSVPSAVPSTSAVPSVSQPIRQDKQTQYYDTTPHVEFFSTLGTS